MKRTHALFCYLILIFIMTGCGNMPKKTTPLPYQTAPQDNDSAENTPETTAAAPRATEKAPAPELIGSAQTELLDKTDSRIHNIQIAIDEINGHTLASGEVFSFNGVVGERTAAKGYKKAPILVGKQKENECGGGVCQVSTTVYQAARAAGLAIIERNSHQKNVGYASQGNDAAVSYGTLDMRFKNNTDYTVKIHATVGGGVVRVEIYKLFA